MAAYRRRRPNLGMECRWGMKMVVFNQYLALSRAVNAATVIIVIIIDMSNVAVRCYRYGAAEPWQVDDTRARLVAVSGGVCCWRDRDGDVFMASNLNVTPKTTEQHLVVRNDKFEAGVTNDKSALVVLYS